MMFVLLKHYYTILCLCHTIVGCGGVVVVFSGHVGLGTLHQELGPSFDALLGQSRTRNNLGIGNQ